MNISYNWLKTYFEKEIPKADELAELFNTHMFEVESILPYENDFILDVKVLPDRAHHDLSHRGIAREIFAITGIEMNSKKIPFSDLNLRGESSLNCADVEVKNESDLCRRYVACRIENVSVAESPKWLKERLESIGARSINNIVDITNFVMFDLGQPLHAFDADKIVGPITIRLAKNGEQMTLLDGREVVLSESDLLIADDSGPLVIAGVKGGKRAEVTNETKNIIIESANFDPVVIRRTSTRLDLRNDSSKRFENEISPELAGEAMDVVSGLIKDLCSEAKFGKITDNYKKIPEKKKISCSAEFISDVIGVEIGKKEIISILERLGCVVAENGVDLVVEIPNFRLDLNIPEDIADEVGRIYGYDKLPSVLPPKLAENETVDKTFYYSEKVKNILVEKGFSEVILYSLVPKGFFEITYPLASDKSALRENLAGKMKEALVLNTRNAPLLDLETIKIFEIGNVFQKEGEKTSLCVGVFQIKKKKGITSQSILEDEIKNLQNSFSYSQEYQNTNFEYKIETGEFGAICEIDFDKISARTVLAKDISSLNFTALPKDIKYKPFSQYPFAVRDVAFFANEKIYEQKIADEIKQKAGEYLVHLSLFDVFTKVDPNPVDGQAGITKTSYAYHLVFQAVDKTLVEDEITSALDRVYSHLKSLGFEIR